MDTAVRAIKVGDVRTIDGDDYRVEEFDPATNAFFVRQPRADAGEFLDADKLDLALARGQIAFAQRQLPLGFMGVWHG